MLGGCQCCQEKPQLHGGSGQTYDYNMTIQSETALEGGISTGIPRRMTNRQLSIVERMVFISIQEKFPHLLEKPGNKKIKQVELVSKWGPYIPDKYKKGSQMIYLTRM